MTKMTKKDLIEVLRHRIARYENEWNKALMNGDQRGADLIDGRQKELQDTVWMLEEIEITEEG